MEGVYFFGEYQRWNLGWSNPNQAGVFIAMWIPWLWALGAWVAGDKELGVRRSWQGLRRDAADTLVLAAELVLWFLLCKTYSRGALVAIALAGTVFFVMACFTTRKWPPPGKVVGRIVGRLAGIGILLMATGFFSRIDPRFVSQDASAGNRLVLWKGGLQMIAESPWYGWGVGQSGAAFGHWFQPLEATEKYGGMVNSYLHVAVERGLPVLSVVLAGALGLCLIPWLSARVRRREHGLPRDAAVTLQSAAGCSWLVFLLSNLFSTLWIFEKLWWLAAADGVIILALAVVIGRKAALGIVSRSLGFGAVLSLMISATLFLAGTAIRKNTKIGFEHEDQRVVVGAERLGGELLFYADPSVLGEDWGKEVRRLADAGVFKELQIAVPSGAAPDGQAKGQSPLWIVACGMKYSEGFSVLAMHPGCRLILVHPSGKPGPATPPGAKVTVILPMLDTRDRGRAWKAACLKNGWACRTSPGVGQDVRLVWPDVLLQAAKTMR